MLMTLYLHLISHCGDTEIRSVKIQCIIAACRDRDLASEGSKNADGRLLEGPTGRGSTDPPRSSTLPQWNRAREHCGGEIRGVASGMDGLRQPPSGMSSFSITELHSSPSDCARTSSERTPPPPLTPGSTATVLARYWPPPDGQPGRQTSMTEGTCLSFPFSVAR